MQRPGDGQGRMRVLICGGREFSDEQRLREILVAFVWHGEQIGPGCTVITGGARGADTLAHQWALKCGCETEVYHADWDKHGRAAGPIRNQEMLDKGRPDLVIAFPGGRGTAHMMRIAKAAGIAVHEVR